MGCYQSDMCPLNLCSHAFIFLGGGKQQNVLRSLCGLFQSAFVGLHACWEKDVLQTEQ